MGDAARGTQASGLTAAERARALDEAGNTQEAAVVYKEHIACARRTLQAPSLSNTVRKLLSDSIEECQKRVTEIGFQQGGRGGLPGYFAYLPEAPATKPVTQLSTDAGVSRGASRAPAAEGALSSGVYANVDEDEKKGDSALTTSIELDEQGRRTGWAQAGAKDTALAAYIQAAEHYFAAVMTLERQTGGGDDKDSGAKAIEARLTRKQSDVLSRAKALKNITGVVKATQATTTQQQQPGESTGRPRSAVRSSQGKLSSEEVEILKESAMVNGKLFLPWVAEDLQEKFDFDKPWEDPDGRLRLSGRLRVNLIGWKRPSEVMPGKPQMIGNLDPVSIRQNLVTDSSLLASLCVASAYERRFDKQLITGIIFPQVWHTNVLVVPVAAVS
ncbi:unnamed protein product [Ectocarpus sp. 4 AP-2014]